MTPRIVYSTSDGRVCPTCGRPADRCSCRVDQAARSARGAAAGDGVVRVGRETSGRRGKGVTVVTGAPLGAIELAELGARLKRVCGAGGTVRDGVIEIQGDHRDRLVAELEKLGWKVKRSGG